VFVGAGVGRGSAGIGVGCEGAVEGSAVLVAGFGVAFTAESCVAAGVGGCTEGGGSGEVCDSAVAAGVSGAEGVGVGAGAGLRRAALGANFLPVVFSGCGLAKSAPHHGTTHY
jgi:hypothetical protein